MKRKPIIKATKPRIDGVYTVVDESKANRFFPASKGQTVAISNSGDIWGRDGIPLGWIDPLSFRTKDRVKKFMGLE